MTITPEKLDELEQLAELATPGPWVPKELPRDMQRDGYKFSISRGGLGWWIAKVTHEANGGSGVANATYIAACDPATVRELVRLARIGLTSSGESGVQRGGRAIQWPDGINTARTVRYD